jgi:hypothetical protein
MGVKKRHVARGGKNIIFRRGGGGINIVFGPKYRPLIFSVLLFSFTILMYILSPFFFLLYFEPTFFKFPLVFSLTSSCTISNYILSLFHLYALFLPFSFVLSFFTFISASSSYFSCIWHPPVQYLGKWRICRYFSIQYRMQTVNFYRYPFRCYGDCP